MYSQGRPCNYMSKKKTLGILGGMGPVATVYFYKLITEHTVAARDSDHLNILITSRADIPDRTDFIMGRTNVSPAPFMCRDAVALENMGADVIAVPCNTAHYFHDDITAAVSIPVLNIVSITADHVKRRGFTRAGILATEGTIRIGAYKRELQKLGVGCVEPDEKTQAKVTEIIYDYVKAGRPGGDALFKRVAREMYERGCDCLILGCTELSLVSDGDENTIDSLETLAYASITACGGESCGFSDAFSKAYETNISQDAVIHHI